MAKFSVHCPVSGFSDFLSDFDFFRPELRVRRGLIGFIVVLRFETPQSQPGKFNIGPVSTHVHDFGSFQGSGHDSGARYLSCFRPGQPKSENSSFPGRTEKLRAEKLCRMMVVSPRDLNLSAVLCLIKISDFRSFLKISQPVHL